MREKPPAEAEVLRRHAAALADVFNAIDARRYRLAEARIAVLSDSLRRLVDEHQAHAEK